MPVSTGEAYVFPPVLYASSAVGIRVSFQPPTPAVRSLTMPASACWNSTPPPQVWKMSGGSPAWTVVVSLVLNASFSSGVISNFTPGWAAEKRLAIAAHSESIGSVLAMCHQRIFPLDPDDFSSPSPQAPRTALMAPAPARPSTDRRPNRIVGMIQPPSHIQGRSHRALKEWAHRKLRDIDRRHF